MRKFLVAVAALAVLAACAPAGNRPAAAAPAEWHAVLTCTTNSTGHCTQVFAHPLGVVPVVQVTPDNLTAIVHTYSATAASFRVRVMQSASTAWANRTVTLNVSAFAPTVTPTAPPTTTPPTTTPTTQPTTPPTTTPPTTDPTTTPPTGGGFPDASTTGPTGALTVLTGAQQYRTAGQVVENVELRTDDIYVAANNVVFRNCRIVYTGALDAGFTIVNIATGVTGTRFEHCEIDGQSKIARAIKGIDGVTVVACNIHHTGNAVEVADKVSVTDSYLHDIFTPAGLDWHADGIQTGETVSDILVQHNTILLTGAETGAINIIGAASDTMTNVLVDNNLMAGGGYTVYLGAGHMTNVRATNNRFSTRYFPNVGQWNIWYEQWTPTRTGNTIYETGAAANAN